MVWHDDWPMNNFGDIIPGLAEMLQERERLDGRLDESRKANHKRRQTAAAVLHSAKVGIRDPDCEAITCRAIRQVTNSCTFFDMGCDPVLTHQFYSVQQHRRVTGTAR